MLYWTELFWPSIGGVEVLSEPLLVALAARGHECTVVTSHGNRDLPDREHHTGLPIYRYPFQAALTGANPGQIHRLLREVAQLKRAVRPQLIHVQFSDPSVFFHLHTADAQPAPTLVSLHVAPPAPSSGDSLLGRAFRSAAWITAPSEAILADVHAYEPETRGRSSVIVPSRWREAFGLIALQAAQMARPVVATRVGGLPETVREGETGLLVEREASAAMAGALSFLLQHPETARQMGQEGRRRAHAVFGWEQSVAAHDQLYRQIAEGFVHGRPVRAG